MSGNFGDRFDWLAARDQVQGPEVAELLNRMPESVEVTAAGMCLYAPLKEIEPASRLEKVMVWIVLTCLSGIGAVFFLVMGYCLFTGNSFFDNFLVKESIALFQETGDWFTDHLN